MIIGVDTGGTFTDVIRRDADGQLRVHKLLSTPDDPSRAIGDGVEAVLDPEVGADKPRIVHGTTVATNALLERQGSRLALVTTAGFEDLLTLQRQNRPDLYDLEVERPEPLAGPEDAIGVDERREADGSVRRPLDDAEIDRVVDWVDRAGYEAVALCLLHAWADASHEERIAEALRRRLPEVHVSVSSEVVGEFREYERASTTCVNAFVAPVMARYLRRLADRVEADDIQILQSSGGRVDIEHASEFPVHTVLSGPAGGVVGARRAAGEVGDTRIISFDMGGTSSDVSLCDGELEVASEATIDGLPVHAPVIDIHTVGAGGGSIAYVDPGGVLRVGPRSAGADPGPACYGEGGREPTVTDAHVLLGRIRPGHFLGGRMEIDVEAARRAVGELAGQLDLSVDEAARGILEVADAAMVRALKVISLERGHDPRDFSLVSFGGAGGLHACRLAEALEIGRVIVPRSPGVLSAFGMLHADFQRLVSRTLLVPLDEIIRDPSQLGECLALLESEALTGLDDPEGDFELNYEAQLRYAGQSFEIEVPVDWQPDDETFADPTEPFEAEHERLYGYRADDRPVELVGIRLTARRPGPESEPADRTSDEPAGELYASSTETVGFADGDAEAQVLERSTLSEGDTFDGPAVVTEYSGTTVIPPGWRAEQTAGHLVLESEGSES